MIIKLKKDLSEKVQKDMLKKMGGVPLCCLWLRLATFAARFAQSLLAPLGAQDASLRGRSDTHRGRSREHRLPLFTVVLFCSGHLWAST